MSKAKNFRKRQLSSDEEDVNDAKERIEEAKFVQKQRVRTQGIDVYSLAIGERKEETDNKTPVETDPWRIKTGGLVDMQRIQEKRGNEIVRDMNSNFAHETNQRDEDAEMQKFIEERLATTKRLAAVSSAAQARASLMEDGQYDDAQRAALTAEASAAAMLDVSAPTKFKTPEDALFDVPHFLIRNTSKHRSEESLSEQMLSGIPEVELGVGERIRNIEDTERAKQRLRNPAASAKAAAQAQYSSTQNQYVQHKRFDDALINPDHMIRPRFPRAAANAEAAEPVVGDAPKHELLMQTGAQSTKVEKHRKHTGGRSYGGGRASDSGQADEPNAQPGPAPIVVIKKVAPVTADPASDELCLERFKKNIRNNRGTKIKLP